MPDVWGSETAIPVTCPRARVSRVSAFSKGREQPASTPVAKQLWPTTTCFIPICNLAFNGPSSIAYIVLQICLPLPLMRRRQSQSSVSRRKDAMVRYLWGVPDSEENQMALPPTSPTLSGVFCPTPKPYKLRDLLKHEFESSMKDHLITASSFASHSSDLALNPGLEISGVGQVGLPLSPELTEAIARVCCQKPLPPASSAPGQLSAPEGPLTLDAEHVTFRNPEWNAQVGTFVGHILGQLSLPTNTTDVRTEFQKLILSGQGSLSLPQEHRKNIGSAFGTLAICLPSSHEGGEIGISYQGDDYTWSTCKTSNFGFSCAAWTRYTTLTQHPVTSGHQIMLIYNLSHRPTLSMYMMIENRSGELDRVLESWSRWSATEIDRLRTRGIRPSDWFSETSKNELPALFHFIDKPKRYRTPDLANLDCLHKAQIAALQKACTKSGCRLFLATLEQEDQGLIEAMEPDELEEDYEDYKNFMEHDYFLPLNEYTVMEDRGDTIFRLRTVTDSAGNIITQNITTNEDLCAYDPRDDNKPDAKQWSRGSFPIRLSQFIRHIVAVVVPEAFYYPFMLHAANSNSLQPSSILGELREACQNTPENQIAREQLHDLCRIILTKSDWGNEVYREVALSGFELRDQDVVHRSFTFNKDRPQDITEIVAVSLSRYGFDFMRPLPAWLDPNQQANKTGFDEWCTKTLAMLLDRFQKQRFLQEGEGRVLALLAARELKAYSEEYIVPVIIKRATETGFVVQFVLKFCEWRFNSSEQLEKEPVVATCQKLLPAILKGFTLLDLSTASIYPLSAMRSLEGKKENFFINPATLVQFIEKLQILELLVEDVFQAIEKSVLEILPKDIKTVSEEFIFPFIESLTNHLHAKTQNSEFINLGSNQAAFIPRLLKLYITARVQPYPRPSTDWRQPLPLASFCCADCANLRAFFEDPSRSAESFRIGGPQRRHLIEKLDPSCRWEVIREGLPHALQVTKTNRYFDSMYQTWTARAQHAESQLSALARQCPLSQVLGNEAYEDLRRFAFHIPDPVPETGNNQRDGSGSVSQGQNHTAEQSTPTASPSASATASASRLGVSTVPRKRSFVDLCDD
ncbi:hypothetical protein BJY04DRAFT_223306 [Aspergillus karnatakaensis]|uniref:uncharacterized protein n=1 Tax=Aspergillus karnatakaensis TaxID=1810916 RepID=UPI003CCCB09B